MEKKVIELVSMIFRMLIRNWAKDNTVVSQNLIDFEQIAQAFGLQVWDSMKFNYTIQNYIADIAKHFFEDIEIESNERKEEILNEIIKDVEKVNLSEETVALEFFKPDVLKNEILKNGQETVKLWNEKGIGLYENCVSYVAKASVEFILKWPSFTPKALTVVMERQAEYQKYLQKILNEIHNMKNLYKSTEITYRDFENKYRETILERYGKVELIGAGINNRKIKKYNITSAYIELNCLDYEDEIEISQVLKNSNIAWIRGEAGSGKTTFLKWVAICSAGNDYKKVENIRGTVPIIIQVRGIQEWPINLRAYVNRFTELSGYQCPEGWLDSVLKENRALILIDGLDEVSENRRDDVYDFVEGLLKKYPKIKIILTARNSVREEVTFHEKRYEICPMKMNNIKKFIRYWHRAILHDDAIVDDREIKQLENNLIGRIGNSPALKNLARTPLLCAMLCALNYINEQHLPENKMELYESCCKMLIDSRDAERGIQKSNDENLKVLDYSKKKRILEEMASLCAANATFTNFEMQAKIEQQISRLIPPEREQINEMSQAGNYLLPFLKDKDGFSDDDRRNCLLLLYTLDNEDTLPDVVSYIQGKGNVQTKKLALEILSKYDDTILYEQGIKEQLQEVLFEEVKGDKLVTYDLLLSMIEGVEIRGKDKEILENIQELHVIENMKKINDYYGRTKVHKYFSGVRKLILSGKIEDIDFLDYYNNLEELVFTTRGDLSLTLNSIAERKTLQSIKKIVMHAGQIEYFTDNDLRNMVNLEEVEIQCLSEQIEIDFDIFENNKGLKKVVLKLAEVIIEELEEKIERLRNKREELTIIVDDTIGVHR